MEYPKKLYKFYKFDHKLLNVIIENEIWHSDYLNFNDPFESKFDIINDLKLEEVEALYEKICNFIKAKNKDFVPKSLWYFKKLAYEDGFYDNLKEGINYENYIIDSISDYIKNEFPRVGIASFSSTYTNTLMWSHYADSHKGICIEIETNKLNKKYSFKRVEYPKSIKLNKYTTSEIKHKLDKNNNFIDDIFNEIINRKSNHWKYENEWRSTITIGKGESRSQYLGEAITGIIFGLKCPSEVIKTIVTAFKVRQEIAFYKLYYQKDFKLAKNKLYYEEYQIESQSDSAFDLKILEYLSDSDFEAIMPRK